MSSNLKENSAVQNHVNILQRTRGQGSILQISLTSHIEYKLSDLLLNAGKL